jgi:hypothetical protein
VREEYNPDDIVIDQTANFVAQVLALALRSQAQLQAEVLFLRRLAADPPFSTSPSIPPLGVRFSSSAKPFRGSTITITSSMIAIPSLPRSSTA